MVFKRQKTKERIKIDHLVYFFICHKKLSLLYNLVGDYMKKITTFILLVFSFITLNVLNVKAEDETVINEDYNLSKSAILIDAKTNKILKEENSNLRLHMASMTKVMSLLLFFEAIDEGRLSFDKMITTSKNAASKGGSQIFLEVGEQMSVDDLLKSICIASANDATVALAEAISGSEEAFVNLMNKKVESLGLTNTVYSNSTGLPNNKPHYTTAYDMAIISSELINRYPKALEYTSLYEDYVRRNTPKQFWLVNTNKMVKHINGVDGLKTGWTESAGYCLTCTKEENGLRLISVVMGSKTVGMRTAKTLELLNYGFSNFKYQVVLKKGTIVKTNEDLLMNPNKYNIVLSKDFGLVLDKNEEIKDYNISVDLDYKKIKNFETSNIGTARFYQNGKLIGKVSLEILEKTEKLSFFELFVNILKSIF